MGLRKGERAIAGWGHNQNKAKYVSAAAASSARLFDTNSRVLVLWAPTTIHHPPPTHRLSFLRFHFWVAALSLCLSFTIFSAFEPLCLLPKSQSRFNARSFWSCSLPRRKW